MPEPSSGQAAIADRSDRRRCRRLRVRYGPVESFRARASTLAGSISRFCATPGGGGEGFFTVLPARDLLPRTNRARPWPWHDDCLSSVKPAMHAMHFTGRSPDGIADEE